MKNTKKNRLIIGIILIILGGVLMATQSYAQPEYPEHAGNSGWSPEAIADTVQLDEVAITANFRATENTASTNVTIEKKEIKKYYAGYEMPMLLARTPSSFGYSDGGHNFGYSYFRLRGIDQTRINMTLNGAPMNEPEDYGVYFSNFPGFQRNLNSLQFQRGVGLSSNGVASYGGSIQFESPNVLEDQHMNLVAGAGSFGTFETSAGFYTGKLQNKTAWYGRWSGMKTDGYKNSSGSDGASFFLTGGYFGDKDILKITAFSGEIKNEMAWFGVTKEDIELDARTNYNNPDADDRFDQNYVQIQYTRALNVYQSLTTTVYYNHLLGNWEGDWGTGEMYNYYLRSNFIGGMLNWSYNKDWSRTNIGIHGNWYERDHAESVLPYTSQTNYFNTGYKSEFSIFLKQESDINSSLTAFVDVQVRVAGFDYKGDVEIPNQMWMFLNPKAGVMYSLKHYMENQSKLYFSVGQSHREPTRGDMFGGLDNLYVPEDFTELDPERVTDFELGHIYKTKSINIRTNGFYMNFKNELTLVGAIGQNSLPLTESVDASYRTGLEFDFTFNNKNWYIVNHSTYQYSRIKADENITPVLTPDFIIQQGIDYRLFKNFVVGVYGNYFSESFLDLDNEFTLPQNVTLNGSLKYLFGQHSVVLRINNFLDEEASLSSGYVDSGVPYYFVQAPRNFYLTLNLNF